MNIINIGASVVLVVALGSSLTASATDTASASNPIAMKHTEIRQDREKRQEEFFQRMTERMADRMEIKASQQSAWQAYAKILESTFAHPAQRPEYKTDAVSISRMYADMAAERAKKLAVIADATVKFQEVLTLDQRKTFDQMVVSFVHRRGGYHGMRHEGGDGRWGHDGRDGEHPHRDGEFYGHEHN